MMVMRQPGVREPSRMSAKDKAVLAGEGKG